MTDTQHGIPSRRSDDDEPQEDPLLGRVLEERYRLEERLGEGGVGVVYRGVHVRLGRPVAIKVLQRSYGEHEGLRLRFEREARAMAALSHPNIVPLTDYGVAEGMPYLAMELLKGESLGDVLHREGAMAPARALDIERQVLRALAYAHGEGLAHRDLKPDNVFLQTLPDHAHHVRLLDFGLAKFVLADDARDGPQVTVAGLAFGTPAYMAPEQAAGRPSSLQSDVYAAGVLLFEMLAGRRPYEGDPTEVLRQHLLADPPTLASICPERRPVPELDALLQRALAKSPDARFDDAGAMLEAVAALPTPVMLAEGASHELDPTGATVLARGAALEPPAASTPAGPPSSQTPRLPRLWLAAAGGLAFLLLFVGTCAGFCVGRRPRDGEPAVAVVQQSSPPPAAPAARAAQGAPSARTGAASARPASPARDPWAGGAAMPPVLAAAKQRLDAGERPGDSTVRALRAYSAQNRSDPRALLLLGRIYLGRGWRSDALDRYERAWRRDPGARGDPHMLADMVGLVEHDSVGHRAARLVEEIYGPEALPAVERALATPSLSSEARQRLLTLRSAIAR